MAWEEFFFFKDLRILKCLSENMYIVAVTMEKVIPSAKRFLHQVVWWIRSENAYTFAMAIRALEKGKMGSQVKIHLKV